LRGGAAAEQNCQHLKRENVISLTPDSKAV